MKKPVPLESASTLIDEKIRNLGDWRGKTLTKVREIIHAADPEVVEEWKWVKPTNPGTPVFSHEGIVCTGETYKNVVKMTLAKGAALKDPSGLFNFSLDGNVRRAIDIHEGDKIDVAALQDLIRAAVALNLKGNDQPKPKPKPQRASSKRTASRQRETHHGTRPATVPGAKTRKSADPRIDATCLMRVVGPENSFR
jgi:hypothetical protein